MRVTRREALAGAAAGVLGAAGIYELVDRLGGSPARPRVTARPPEQHVLDGVALVKQEGVEVLVPPLHHTLVTATVKANDLRDAQKRLEDALLELDGSYELTPAGLGVTVAWGLPYFRRYVPRSAERHLPFDRRAGKPVLLD